MNIGRIVIGLCALLLCGGCITSKPDMADHYPAGYEAQCQRANDRAKGDVRNVLGHEPQRIFGWTVEIVPGEPCPYGGRALRSTQSPTGWAAALTGGCTALTHACLTQDPSRDNSGPLYGSVYLLVKKAFGVTRGAHCRSQCRRCQHCN